MLALLLALATAQAPLCGADELVVLGCQAKKKTLAVCAGPRANPSWVQYRFGPPGKPEMVFPKEQQAPSVFRFVRQELVSGTGATLTFVNEGTTYEVWTTEGGRDSGAGVNVRKGSKHLATVACTGDFEQNWSQVETLLARPPAPLEGRSLKEICNDDALLLLRFGWDELRFEGGFQRTCCGKGPLGDDDRCQLDWPSSDMPTCAEIDLLRNRLFARYGYAFKDPKYKAAFEKEPWYAARADFQMSWVPAVAQQNGAKLKQLVAAGACVADEPTDAASMCARAASIYADKAFAAARGHMDGMQQGDIHATVLGQCRAGWSPTAAFCFADGGQGCEVHLTDAERKALDGRVKEIVAEE